MTELGYRESHRFHLFQPKFVIFSLDQKDIYYGYWKNAKYSVLNAQKYVSTHQTTIFSTIFWCEDGVGFFAFDSTTTNIRAKTYSRLQIG